MYAYKTWRVPLALIGSLASTLCVGLSVVLASEPIDNQYEVQAFPPIPIQHTTYWFDNGFAQFATKAPELVGTPLSVEMPGDEPNSVIQLTSTGELYWRGLGYSVVHFDGYKRVALTADRGLVDWLGADLDPPPAPVINQPDSITGSCGLPICGALGQRLYCIEGYESSHSSGAVNPTSGASGWLQWLPGTARQWGVVIGNRVSEWNAAARIAAEGERFFRSQWVPLQQALC